MTRKRAPGLPPLAGMTTTRPASPRARALGPACALFLALAGCDGLRRTVGLPSCTGVILFHPQVPELTVGRTHPFTGFAIDERTSERCPEATADAKYLVRWSSSRADVASIDEWGRATALKPGVTRIVAANVRSGKDVGVNITVVPR